MDERQTKVSIIEIGIGVGGLGEGNGQTSPTERLIDIHLGLGSVKNADSRKRGDTSGNIWTRHENKLHHRHRLVGIDFSPRWTQNTRCKRELLDLDETQSKPLTYEIKQRDLTSIFKK
jgi:hypothetical protein